MIGKFTSFLLATIDRWQSTKNTLESRNGRFGVHDYHKCHLTFINGHKTEHERVVKNAITSGQLGSPDHLTTVLTQSGDVAISVL